MAFYDLLVSRNLLLKTEMRQFGASGTEGLSRNRIHLSPVLRIFSDEFRVWVFVEQNFEISVWGLCADGGFERYRFSRDPIWDGRFERKEKVIPKIFPLGVVPVVLGARFFIFLVIPLFGLQWQRKIVWSTVNLHVVYIHAQPTQFLNLKWKFIQYFT